MKISNILHILFLNQTSKTSLTSTQHQTFQFKPTEEDLMRGLMIEHQDDDIPPENRPKQLSNPQNWNFDEITHIYTIEETLATLPFGVCTSESIPVSDDLNFNTVDGKFMLKHMSFDDKTFQNTPKEHLPQSWEPQQIIEEGRSIGQNVCKMHNMGYTGKDITVAVIDSPIIMHQDIESSLVRYEQMDNTDKYNQPADFHGQAVADIISGDKDGVAPDSNLVYFAATGGVKGEPMLNDRLQALRKIIELNQNASPEDKIRVVSLSWGVNEDEEGYDEYIQLLQTLINNGVFVVTGDMNMGNGNIYGTNMPYQVLQKKEQMGDQNDFSNYVATTGQPGREDETLCILSGDRTVASAISSDKYRHDSQSSTSWAAPALAGIYTCALQCAKENDVELTPQKFWQWALETGVPVNYENGEFGGKAIDTEALCKYIEQQGQNK